MKYSILIYCLILIACASQKETTTVITVKELPSNTSVVEETNENLTTIEVDSRIKYFTAKSGEKVKIKFQLKNTGSNPLRIWSCKTSIGCYVARCPYEPVAPGDSVIIESIFNTTGRIGKTGYKYLTVHANTNPATTPLRVHGVIEE